MPEPIVLVWIGTIVTLLLVLLILLEIHRNNQKREHEEMFGSADFIEKSNKFRLTEKERHTMDKLVRRSVFSNKDALFNSSALFEDAVNRFYEFRKLESIREITLSSPWLATYAMCATMMQRGFHKSFRCTEKQRTSG